MARARHLSSAASPRDILVDTGILVALYDRADPLHKRAARWLAGFGGQLHTVEPVLSEASFFLPPPARAALADLAAGGTIRMHHPDSTGLRRIGEVLRKYADLDPDWADACLVWLAERSGVHRIATIDVTDFGLYRIHGRGKFAIEVLA
jgi:predicted nucleic acid-binding protein